MKKQHIDSGRFNKYKIMKQDQMPSLTKAMTICTENSIFVEIGTWKGDFAEALLKYTRCKKLYCVDPYRHFTNDEYPDAMNDLSQQDFDTVYENVKTRLSKYGDRVEFIRRPSTDAAQLIADNTVDFAYIDGNHDYAYVDADIKAWYPKIKTGGYLCGDDVYSHNLEEHDSENNIVKIWSYNSNGTPSCWGKYGTYPACIKNESDFGVKFEFEETQFSCLK